MNPNQALWEKGDFTHIAAFMRQSGEAVVESIGIKDERHGGPCRFWVTPYGVLGNNLTARPKRDR